MTLSLYLGRGVVSRGRMTITPALVTTVAEHPYLRDAGDREAVIAGIKSLVDSLSVIPNITFVLPPKGQTIEGWFDSVRPLPHPLRSNLALNSTTLNMGLTSHSSPSPPPTGARTTGWAPPSSGPTTVASQTAQLW